MDTDLKEHAKGIINAHNDRIRCELTRSISRSKIQLINAVETVMGNVPDIYTSLIYS